jgi:sugar O-acyltransferase (sialic acid O-acetyltransferase NeuD family)
VVIAMATDLVIIGIGGHGRECLDIARAMNEDGAGLNILGFVDDRPSSANRVLVERFGYPILGSVAEFMNRPPPVEVCIGIGNGAVRCQIDRVLRSSGLRGAALVHPEATIGSAVILDEGVAIWAGARLTTNIRIGRHVHINQNATVAHDSVLADYATLNPMGTVSGNVLVGTRSMIGAGAVVLQGRTVGSDAAVGSAACVVTDVPDGTTVKGIPAR